MADQCIVCLEPLDVEPSASPPAPTTEQQQPLLQDGRRDSSHERLAIEDAEALATAKHNKHGSELHVNHDHVAQIQACGHMLHDACLREWTDKANSCPICRQTFYVVNVYDKVGGQLLSTRRVEDKKQVPEFDPRAWAEDAPEEPELPSSRCPVCNSSGNEEVLLLCDGCDAAYHTHCIDLDSVPSGAWFCMECVDAFGPDIAEPVDDAAGRNGGRLGPRYYFPRTQASMRRARQRARSDDWQGAWGRITGRIWDALELDLDYQDDEDSVVFEGLRRSRQLRERERQEHERWQQRLNIAARLGARDVFANSIPEFVARPQPPQQSREERLAWGAFEKARGDMESRKRKSRSATAEPNDEPHQEPERKLKRPRTRRLLPQNGESSTAATTATTRDPGPSHRQEQAVSPPATTAEAPAPAPAAAPTPAPPSFLASLLKEVEQSAPYDAESLRNMYGTIPGVNDAPSRARSPSLHSQGSITPPPHRASSPQMTLSSHIEPRYPMPNYSPTRGSSPSSRHQQSRPSSPPALPREGQSSPETSDSEQRGRRERPAAGRHGALELRQPQPRRPRSHNHNNGNNNNPTTATTTATTSTTTASASASATANNNSTNNNNTVARAPRSENTFPAGSPLPLEMKESISRIVRSALKPHWRSSRLTAEQYEAINRDVSRKMYDEVKDPAAGAAELVGSEDVRRGWERRVASEVKRAVDLLQA